MHHVDTELEERGFKSFQKKHSFVVNIAKIVASSSVEVEERLRVGCRQIHNT